jgi:signal transduction histidine kinase
MAEMRRLLDVLRTDDAAYTPQPGLARLGDLLEEVRLAGVPVELIEEGDRPHIPPGLDLVAFRIVQESLTNVRKHAPGARTKVLMRFGRGAFELDIANAHTASPPAIVNGVAAGGHGLIGMRERVHLFGGTFGAGPSEDGGFLVHAVLPLSEEPV